LQSLEGRHWVLIAGSNQGEASHASLSFFNEFVLALIRLKRFSFLNNLFESVEQGQCFGLGHGWTDAAAFWKEKCKQEKIDQSRSPTAFECFV
jgi:hypothetical protein